MEARFQNILQPLKLKNTVLKTRLMYPNAMPHFLQGPETYPAPSYLEYYSSLAKNGASLIYFHNLNNPWQRESPSYDARHFAIFDYSDPLVHNYVSQMCDAVHFYGGRILLPITDESPDGKHYAVKARPGRMMMGPTEVARLEARGEKLEDYAEHFGMPACEAFTGDTMELYIRKQIDNALFYKNLGFDGMYVGLRHGSLGEFLDPAVNDRTDEYGGSLENRLRFPLRLLTRLREAVGKDFILSLDLSVCSEKGRGSMAQDLALDPDILLRLEPLFDLIHLRSHAEVATSTTGWNSSPGTPEVLKTGERLKKAGVTLPIACGVGFTTAEEMSQALESGQADMISVGRLFIANPELGRLIAEDRSEDIVPCLRCNKCHGANLTGPWVNICSVNPRLGLSPSLTSVVPKSGEAKKVAVIGGGPAGMAAAVMAARAGHSVTLYEAGERLGGQLLYADYPYFKWPVKNYREWLEKQLVRWNVDVRTGMRAMPDEIRARGYDTVMAALGAEAVRPEIKGAERENVLLPIEVYGRESGIGKRVFCIGGSDTSGETALYLADLGHKVTAVTRKSEMFHDSTPIHYLEFIIEKCEDLGEDFSSFTGAHVLEIGADHVRWLDSAGEEHKTQCDTVIAAGGMRPRTEQALEFASCAPQFFLLGDCVKAGNIHDAVRTAYAAVCQL